MTEPSNIAALIACVMSRGRTNMAGGGLRPIRCNTASTSAISPRRLSSERLRAFSLSVSDGQPHIGRVHLALGVLHLGGCVDKGRVEARPVGADRLNVGFDAPSLLLRGPHRVLDAAQLHLRRGFVVVLRRGWRGIG